MEISFEDSSSIPVFNKKVCRVCLKDSTKLKNLYIKKNVDVLEKLRSFIEIEVRKKNRFFKDSFCLLCGFLVIKVWLTVITFEAIIFGSFFYFFKIFKYF